MSQAERQSPLGGGRLMPAKCAVSSRMEGRRVRAQCWQVLRQFAEAERDFAHAMRLSGHDEAARDAEENAKVADELCVTAEHRFEALP